jgi:hypothetical protein
MTRKLSVFLFLAMISIPARAQFQVSGNVVRFTDASGNLITAGDNTNNALRVNIVAGAGSGGTAMTDDAAFTPGSTSITPMGAMLDNTTPDSVDEGDGGVVRMSANRNLFINIRDAAGNERGVNVNASSEMLVNASQSGTWTVQPGNTANTTAWLVENAPSTACQNTVLSSDWAAIPTTNTVVTATTTCVVALVFTNTNATGSQTVSVQDGAGTPVVIVDTLAIPAKSQVTIPMYGTRFNAGVEWSAGGTGINGAVLGYQ